MHNGWEGEGWRTSKRPDERAAASKKQEGGGEAAAAAGAGDGNAGGQAGREEGHQDSARTSAAGVGSRAMSVHSAVCSLKCHNCTQADPSACRHVVRHECKQNFTCDSRCTHLTTNVQTIRSGGAQRQQRAEVSGGRRVEPSLGADAAADE
jgi:hypothetical protein